MGIAFAASIGGLGTIIGTPTNTMAAGLIGETLGTRIGFVEWSMFGVPLVLLGIPLAAWIIARVQHLSEDRFDPAAARAAIDRSAAWTRGEVRLLVLFAAAIAAWIAQPWLEPMLPKGSFTDGTIAAAAGVILFFLPDGTGRPMLVWSEANRAPWDVVLMFGGGLAMALGMTESGLAAWIGQMLLPLGGAPLVLVALVLVAVVIVITEFASNIAVASGILPVVAALIAAMGADPILLALPAAMAATWGFMLPAGTGPNAIAWATGHVALPRVIRAGLMLDVAGVFLIVGVVWTVAAIAG